MDAFVVHTHTHVEKEQLRQNFEYRKLDVSNEKKFRLVGLQIIVKRIESRCTVIEIYTLYYFDQ
jgi:hypothetical protein